MVVRVCNAEHEDGGGGGIQVAETGMGAERRFWGVIGGDARRGTCADGAVGGGGWVGDGWAMLFEGFRFDAFADALTALSGHVKTRLDVFVSWLDEFVVCGREYVADCN